MAAPRFATLGHKQACAHRHPHPSTHHSR
uniref:Uncharacterized protein n=1 Tax=Arundo donax TaxID=35708 RepID=A0A0A9FZ91_ARUDO